MSQVSPAPRRRIGKRIAVLAAAVVPLAFAGLMMGSLADSEDGIHRIPAAIVNLDEMVTQVADDGTETPILAGRLLVTELTGDDSPGMQWQLSNEEEAEAQLAAGEVYAVLTIPSDFSASIVSLSSSEPMRAQLALQTDDAHSYLAGAAAQSLGEGMVKTFGSQLTEQYIAGIYTQFGTVGEAFATAADGAHQLADGATEAAAGATTAADGAGTFASGVDQYTDGVAALSNGLQTMSRETAQLGTLGSGLQDYIAGVGAASDGLSKLAAAMAADPRFSADATLAPYLTQLQALDGGLADATAAAPALSAGAGSLGGLSGGIAEAASGAARLASTGSTLDAGARDLSSGIGELATGLGELSTGADELASGLQEGADRVNGTDALPASDAAAVAADPVGIEVTTAHPVAQLGQIIGTYFVPLGLWVGAIATFLVAAPLNRRALATTARSGRVIGSALVRAGALAAVQALLLVLLMHLAADVAWSLLPVTVLFSLVASVAFTAFHHLLMVAFGRAGLVISLLLLAVQVAAVGGIVPAQALAGPFAWIGEMLPLGWASSGLQQIVAGGSPGMITGAIAALLAFGGLSVALTFAAVARARRAAALTLLTPAAA